MKKYSLKISLLFMAVVMTAALIGCSDNSVSDVTPVAGTSVQDYFPLKAGATVDYTVQDKVHQIVSHQKFTVAGPVVFNGQSNYQWIYRSVEYPNYRDTGFFCIDGNALYYYENPGAQPEKILEGPLIIGKSWERFAPTNNWSNDTTTLIDILTGNNGKGEDSLVTGGGIQTEYDLEDDGGTIATKNFPTTGGNYAIVAAVEELTLADGNSYINCLRIENRTGAYINYYWYAPGAGLVRYVIGANPGVPSDGQIVGEMASQRPF
ncbi:exported hypothetical protein [Candidatus Zixiibacteriota bacterium]|nr:exported hypothetical protein [candidate division Zixibacteria bacterium]